MQTPYSIRDIPGRWPEGVGRHTEEETEHWVLSCCALRTNGCGLDVGVKDGRIVVVG